ncbi:MAG: TRAP transporter permease [Deltaproteobacteria bacterium]|nr:TRAP transporter permease [Deltaproteobacteria bacterium]
MIEQSEWKAYSPSVLQTVLSGKKISSLHIAMAIFVISSALALAMFHLYTAFFGLPEAYKFRSTHYAMMMVLAFFFYPLKRSSWKDRLNWFFLVDLLCIVLSLAIEIYILWDLDAYILRRGVPLKTDIVVGTIGILLLLEATRRCVGWVMFMIVLFFLFQSIIADKLFWIFYGAPSSWTSIIDYIFMRTEGIFGIPVMVMASYIILFFIFGSILLRSGAGKFFLEVSLALTGHRTGGPAKAAVCASAMLGTMTGSAVGNVVTTGSFTIPLMKGSGYPGQFSGAVEATASSGGQIMPPIMGAAAFIIAEFLLISYLEVAIAAAIPATLYFFSVFMMIHFEAHKIGLKALPKEELPRLMSVLKQRGQLLIPILTIIYFLISGYTVMMAAFWGICTVFLVTFWNRNTRMDPVEFLGALEDGIVTAIPIAVACAAAGIIIGSVFISGVGMRLTDMLIQFAGDNLGIALLLTMLASFILGMGITTTADYIILAALVVPALIKLGATPMGAHLFAFYFSSISGITPPVALVSFAAAGLARSSPMRTGVTAFRIGIAAFIVPYMFIYGPELLLIGSLWGIILAVITSIIGVICLAAGVQGWLIRKSNPLERMLLIAASILLIKPGIFTDLPGLCFFAFVIFSQKKMAYIKFFDQLLNFVKDPFKRIAFSFVKPITAFAPSNAASTGRKDHANELQPDMPLPSFFESTPKRCMKFWPILIVPLAVLFYFSSIKMNITQYNLFLVLLWCLSFAVTMTFFSLRKYFQQ